MFRRTMASCLAAASVVIVAVDTPASAVSVTVASGGLLRTAISDANGDPSITEIVLDADEINLGLCGLPGPDGGVEVDNANASGDLDFTGSQDLVIRGGRTARTQVVQNCADRVIDHRGSGTLTLDNVQLYATIADVPVGSGSNVADYSGGGVRSVGGKLVVTGSSMKSRAGSAVDSNSLGNAQTPGNGGGIYSTGDVEIVDSYFADNTAGDGGDGDVAISATNGGHGGAIYVTGGTLDIRSTRLTSNGAGAGGRGVDRRGGSGGSGGAIYGDVVTLTDVNIEGEMAGAGGPSDDEEGGPGGDGGAVFATTSVTAVRSVFVDVSGGAGGLGNADGGSVTLGAQAFGGSGGNGGAIHAPIVTLTDSLVSNAAAGDGGGSTNDQGGRGGNGGAIWGKTVLITDSQISSGRAGDGGDGTSTGGGSGGDGGAVATGVPGATIDATRTYFDDNRAGDGGDGGFGGIGGDGGGLASVGSDPGSMTGPSRLTITLTDTVFDGNTSGSGGTGSSVGFAGRGGAIYNPNNSNGGTKAQNSTFVNNTIGSGQQGTRTGAVLAVDNLTMTFVTLTDNGGPVAIDRTGTSLSGFDYVTASVIGDNAGANCSADFPTQSGGFNVIDDESCDFRGEGVNADTDVIPATDLGLEAITDGPAAPIEAGGPDSPVPPGGPDPDGVGRIPTVDGPLDELISSNDCNTQFRIEAVTADQWGTTRPSGEGCEPGALEIGIDPTPDPGPGPDPDPGPVDPAAELDAAARFVALPPQRLFDTRPDTTAPGPKGVVAPESSIDVQVTGVAGIPADAVAVVMNVTAINATGAGFVTTWPSGSPQPLAATHNLTGPGQNRPNLVTVPIGTDGRVSIYTSGGSHFAGDVAGYYEDVDVATTTGRVVPLPPQRVFDTRPAEAADGPKGKLAAGQTIDVQVAGVAGIPTNGVSAVIMNVAGIDATGRGYVTAFPTGDPRPLAAVLNLNGVGSTNSNLVMIPLGSDGMVSFFSESGAHLSGDVTGYVTDSTSGSTTAGLFVPLTPTRAFDTRPAESAAGPKGYVTAGATIDGVVGPAIGVPSSASGVVLNVAGVQAGGRGFVTGFPAGDDRPLSATLNLGGLGDTRPNAAILPIGADDQVSFYSDAGTHLVVDTSGYFIG